MLQIGARSNADDVLRQLQASQKQTTFALAKALTATAGLVKEAERAELVRTIDRPKDYTLNSLYIRPATKQSLTATVWLKDDKNRGAPPDKYLNPDIKGGGRQLKAFESALRGVGALPTGYYIVPGAAAKMDPYGNIDPALINSILAYFSAFPDQGFRKNLTDARKAKLAKGTKRKLGVSYFAGSPGDGKLPPGIWQQTTFAHGTAIRPIMIFVTAVHYQQLVKFYEVAQSTYSREFQPQFKAAYRDALGTSRAA